MRFLLVPLLLAFAASCPAATGLPEPLVSESLGVNIHFTGREEAQVRKIADAGFKFVRMDIAWQRVENKKGEYDFKQFDELVSSLADRGIRTIFIFDYGNKLYDDGLAPHTDEGRAAFGRFVEAATARFKGKGVVWEIWNEPNHPTFWKPIPNPRDYAKLAEVVYRSAKKGDNEAFVVGPALSSWDFSFLESVFKLGLLDNLDAVSLHPYGCAKPEDAFKYYARARKLIRRYAPGKNVPVISGEWGYASCKGFTRERQAQFIVREFLTNLMNNVPLSIWYDWRDDGTNPDDPEHNCGVVDYNLAEKPAYGAFRTLARELDGYRFATCVDAGSDDDYLALFTKIGDTKMAAWTTGKPHKVDTPVDVEAFVLTSPDGQATEVQAKDGKLRIELTESPIYIKPLKPSRRWAVEANWNVSAETVSEKGAVNLVISNRIDTEKPTEEYFVGYNRVRPAQAKSNASPGRSSSWCTAPYVSNGEPSNRLRAIMRVPGLAEPLIRSIAFENSACPTIKVLPPADDTLIISISQPESGNGSAFRGRLWIGNYQGIRLAADSCPITLKAGSDQQIVRLKMTQRPAGIYSFSCRLVDDAGHDVAKLPTRRYSLVDAFAAGSAGAAVANWSAVLGGDAKIPGEAKLIYAPAPKNGAAPVCARIDYKFDAGWKYVQIVPNSPARIPEKPAYARVWIKGEANRAPVYLRYKGADGQCFQQLYGCLDTSDWQVLEGDMSGAGITYWGGTADGVVSYPLSWDSLILVDNPDKQAMSGTVYIGPLMICYD